ncbi:MAG: FISUMP domain-containing protein [Bacteroidales bacterium]
MGEFKFCAVPYGNYTLNIQAQYQWAGVNSTDAQLLVKHFVDIINLSGLKITSGDVDNNGHINAVDALLMIRRYLQFDTSFLSGDWVFEQVQVSITDTSSKHIIIKSLCTGDIDGSHIPCTQTFTICGDRLTDPRDHQKYPTLQIGTQCWIKNNLNIGVMTTDVNISGYPHSDCRNNDTIEKYCYLNNQTYCDTYGGLYDWDEMMQYDTTPGIQGICPPGWHIPDDSEWCILATYLDPTIDCSIIGYIFTDAGGKLKETGLTYWKTPNGGATNEYGFTALGAGGRGYTGGFLGLKMSAPFWSSSKQDLTDPSCWGMTYTNANISHGNLMRTIGYSVRCILSQ